MAHDWAWTAAAVLACLALAGGIAEVVSRLVRAALLAVAGEGAAPTFSSPIVRRPIRITRALVFLGALAGLSLPALDLAGVQVPPAMRLASLSSWAMASGLRILLLGLITYLLIRAIATVAARVEAQIGQSDPGTDLAERRKRARTLSRLIQNGLNIMVLGVASLMILRQLNVDVMPVLTGAGIVGLAVGFGAQTLVKDFISGFFLILENNIRVGDVAKINGTGGLVESVNLRTVVLRDLEGVVHVFPNGSIETLANLTKDYAFAVLDVGVAYKEDTDAVVEALREVGAELQEDSVLGPLVLEPLEVLGVDAFGASEVTIKVRFKTLPLKQWDVAREMRRRIKKRFDALGIEIPFPHVSLYFGEASRPIRIKGLPRRVGLRPVASDTNGGSAASETASDESSDERGAARRSVGF